MAVTLKDVRENWMILAALSAGAVAWGVNSTMLAYAKTDIEKNEMEISEVQSEIVKIRIEATRVATAAEAQKESTERQIDQLIQAVREQ